MRIATLSYCSQTIFYKNEYPGLIPVSYVRMGRKYFKSLTDEERKALKQNIFQRLNIEGESRRPKVFRLKTLLAAGIAASVLLVVGLLLFYNEPAPATQRVLLASTGDNEVKQVVLSDSSTVILNPHSTLYANSDYAKNEREVYLFGNGFFKVRKVPEQNRFIVHANDLQVTVLGTQFNVNATTDAVEVTLTSGRVKLTNDNNQHQQEYMQPGEQVRFDHSSQRLEKIQVDTLLYSAWTKGEWNFRNTSLEEIAGLISVFYGVEVEFKNVKSRNLRMTAVIPVTSLDALLNVIREALPVDIQKDNQHLFIK